MDYSTLITDLAGWAELSPSDAGLLSALPTIIELAEKRCYRELDLLTAYVTDDSAATTPNARSFTLPTSKGRFIDIDLLMVGGALCTFSSNATINALWPSDAVTGTPVHWARKDDTTLLIAPASASALPVSVRGSIRPIALSAVNTSTWLTLYAYDLFFAAAMSVLTGYLREWGAQADDPKLAKSWEDEYAKRLSATQVEELRKKL